MAPTKRTFTREELHDLVWSTPILKLAEEFGISDRGFTKICIRHLVPTPPRGYWAKIEAGLPAKKTPLRSVENKALHTVEVGRRSPRSETILAALATAKAERKRLSEERKRTAAKAADSMPATEVIDPDQPVDVPHRVIAQIAKQLQKAKPDSDGVISAKGVCVHERTLERAIRILHHLARAAETNGVELTIAENSLHISTSEGEVSIVLTEERRRPKHTPTEAELAEYQRLKAKREKDRSLSRWSFGRLEPWPEFDIVYTGKLTIGYNGYGINGRREFQANRGRSGIGAEQCPPLAGLLRIVCPQRRRQLRRISRRAQNCFLCRRAPMPRSSLFSGEPVRRASLAAIFEKVTLTFSLPYSSSSSCTSE